MVLAEDFELEDHMKRNLFIGVALAISLSHTVVKLNASAPGIREAGERFAEFGAFGKWPVELRAVCFGPLTERF